MSKNKHVNYELLNLIGYGLAKFDTDFAKCFGFDTKTAFYEELVRIGVGETTGVIKNRQDLFDPFFENDRKGWWQKGDAYKHRKILIDSLYGDLDVTMFADIVKIQLRRQGDDISDNKTTSNVSPILYSKFNQMQVTGQKAELYFIQNYQMIEDYAYGEIEDARLFGDGYDFQIQKDSKYYLAEIKGLRGDYGSIRMTKNEYAKAQEYQIDYSLVIVKNLDEIPEFVIVSNPVNNLKFSQKTISSKQTNYHSEVMKWH